MVMGPPVLLVLLIAAIGYVKIIHSPISLNRMLEPIAEGIGRSMGGVDAKIETAELGLDQDGGVEVKLTNLQIAEADGDSVVTVPLVSVDLDLLSLFKLQAVPQRIFLVEPKLNLLYETGKGLSLNLQDALTPGAASGASGRGPGVASPVNEDPSQRPSPPAISRGNSPANIGRTKIDLARWLSETSARARSGEDATWGLREVGVRNATVVIDYDGMVSEWQVPEASIDLEHRKRRSIVSGDARITGAAGPWALSVRAEDSERTGHVDLTTTVRDLVPSTLAKAAPPFALLSSVDFPVAVDAFARVSNAGDLISATLDLGLAQGMVGLPGTANSPVGVDAGLLKLTYDGAQRSIALKPSTVRLGSSHITLVGEATAVMGRGGRAQWRFDVKSQGGALGAEEFGIEPVAISSFIARGLAIPETGEFKLEQSALKAGEADISLEGEVAMGQQGLASRFDGRIGPMPLATFKSLWPRGVSPAAREWVGKNLVAGRVQSGAVRVASGQSGDPAAGGLSSPVGDRMSVSMELADLKVAVTPDGAPVEAPRALVRMENEAIEVTIPDATIPAGAHHSVALKGGRFTAVDVRGPAPVGEAAFNLDAPLPALLFLATRPPFALLRPGELPVEGLEGKVTGALGIKIPLTGAVTPDRMKITGNAKISDIRLQEKLGSIEVQGGSVDFDITEQAIAARGDLLLNGVIAKLDWQRILDAEPEKQPPLRVKATLDNSDRTQLGLDVNHIVQGDVPVEITVAPGSADMPAIHLRADLSGAELEFRDLAWKKPAGRSAFLDFDVGKGRAHPIELHNLKIAGDNIAIEGWAAINTENDLAEFYFPDFSLNVVSRLEVQGKLSPQRIWSIKAKGSTYDGRDFFSALFSLGGSGQNRLKPLRPAAGMDIEADVGNMLGHNEVSMRNVKLRVQERADKLTALSAEGMLDGGKPLLALLKRDASGQRVLYAESMDAGQAFKLAGFYKSIVGGRVRLEVNLDGRGAADKTGILWVDNFRVLGDPIVSEVISSAEGSSGQSGSDRVVREVYDFDRMRVPFSAGHDQFVLEESYIRGPIVGATVRGKADFRSQRLDLGGTYIPLQGINSALCAIPLLGAIITGPKCEGVVGLTFAVQGPMARPTVLVNPLSMLTPGILREIMQMTNPSQKVQARENSKNSVPADQRTGSSSASPVRSSGGGSAGGSGSQTIDGWTSETKEPKKRQ
jgi:hypothetical protein